MVPPFLVPPLRRGEPFSGVFVVSGGGDEKAADGVLLPDMQPCMLMGVSLKPGKFSIYGCRMVQSEPILIFEMDPDTVRCAVPELSISDLACSIELFAGFGGMGIAANAVGSKSLAAVDWCPLAGEQLKALGIPTVLVKDIADWKTTRDLHQAIEGRRPVALMGFPCQPFSSQGLQKAFSDNRALRFFDGLRSIFLTQCSAAVLECVTQAGRQTEVMESLRYLADCMDWEVSTMNFDLGVVWPNKRHRWWAILLPKTWFSGGLASWKASSKYRIVQDLFEQWPTWSYEDETELLVSERELCAYQNSDFGDDVRLLGLKMQAATFLHSYGSPLSSCPCTCRSKPIALESLKAKGLRGFYILSRLLKKERYLHPREVCLLLGIPMDIGLAGTLKESLCLLGLVASPIQGVWVFGSLLQNVDTASQASHIRCPGVLLEAYLLKLLDSRTVYISKQEFRLIQISEPGAVTITIKAGKSQTAEDLRLAERINAQWGTSLRTTSIGRQDDNENEIIQIERSSKRQRREPPEAHDIPVKFIVEDREIEVVLTAGSFVFVALATAGYFAECCLVFDVHGSVLQLDDKIWHPDTFHVLVNNQTTSRDLHSAPIYGRGGGPLESNELATFVEKGLTDSQIFEEGQSIFRQASTELNLLWHPKLIVKIQETWTALAYALIREKLSSEKVAYGVMIDAGHWLVFHAKWDGQDGLQIDFWDGLFDTISADMELFARRLAMATDVKNWNMTVKGKILQTHGNHCGTIALLHLRIIMGLPGCYHEEFAKRWYISLVEKNIADNAIGGSEFENLSPSATLKWSLSGKGLNGQQQTLAKLLAEKGVPAEVSEGRAQEVIAKIGTAMVSHALRADNPWQVLKTAANTPSTRMRLITQEEQKAYAEKRAADKFGAQIRKPHKKQRSPDTSVLKLDPELLQLDPQHFQDANGEALNQIKFEEVSIGQRGIALTNCKQAMNFIQDKRSISDKALALLMVDHPPDEVAAAAGIEKLRFPAVYKGTEEQIVVFGSVLNLGDLKVQRKILGPNPKPTVLTTAVVKLMAYKDQMEINWTEFARAPVKMITQILPALSVCKSKNSGHGCAFTHAPLEEGIEDILLEVWGRQFLLNKGSKVGPEQADLFVVFFRVPAAVLTEVITANVNGIYMEPRKDGQRGHHDNYCVVWLPRCDYQQALHLRKLSSFALNLVRLRDRYGLQVLQKDEAKAWKESRPQDEYRAVRVQEIYELSPIPHGTSKSVLEDLLKQWGWSARPLHPGRGNVHHMSWRIGTADKPPQSVFHGFDQDIIATLIKQPKEQVKQPSHIASLKTQVHMKSGAASSTSDPWFESKEDPWSNFKGVNNAPQVPPAQKDRRYVDELTRSVRDDLQEQIRMQFEAMKTDHDSAMTDQDYDEQLHSLRSSVNELKAQNEQMQLWFTQASSKMQEAEHINVANQQALQNQAADIAAVRQELQQSVATTASQLRTALASMQRDIVNQLQEANQKHYTHLEAMMEKKMKRQE